jgi:hypothetical protein
MGALKRWLVLLVILAARAFASDLDAELGYQFNSGPYFQLRYNYPIAKLNFPGEPYFWVLPEIGIFSNFAESYLRFQFLLDTERWTAVLDSRLRNGEFTWRVGLRLTIR